MAKVKKLFLSLCLGLMMVFSIIGLTACGPTVNNFNLVFKVDNESYATISTNGSEMIAIPENPSKEGYTFEGWFWDNGTWEKPFTANSLLDAPISSDMSIYAKFDTIDYIITYETNGGTHNNPASYTVEDSFVLSNAEKIGYTFDGWYNGENEVSSITEGSKGDLTLTAQWTTINYTITYTNTKDVENDNIVSYTIESDTITLNPLVKAGYTFAGWYNGETEVTEIVKGSTGNIELAAKWTPIGYEITYHNVEGATNANPETYDVEDEPLALINAVKEGYTFIGWYTDATYQNMIDEIVVGTTGNLDLYAKFDIINYNITYVYDQTKVTVNGNEDSYTVLDNLTFDALTVISHYQFDGWFTDSSYQTAFTGITVGTTGEQTVYGKITPVVYHITYENTMSAPNDNPLNYTIESGEITFAPIAKAGYTFDGWDVETIASGSTGNKTITARWSLITYNIIYEYDDTIGELVIGSTLKTSYTVEDEFTFTNLVDKTEGYTFSGWYTEKVVGTGTKVDGITLGTIGDKKYYAQWGLDTYTITYHNTKAATNTNATTYTVETNDFSIAAIAVEGYNFLGWYMDEALQTIAPTTITKGSTGNIDLYASWELVSYSISYTLYGGEVVSEQNPERYTIEDSVIFKNPTKDGYIFAGWYNATEGGDLVQDIEQGTTGIMSLYARWLQFESNGGTEIDYMPVLTASSITKPENPTKPYYEFAGWYFDSAFTNEYTFDTLPTENSILYAKWTPIEYMIHYVLNGGTNHTDNPDTYNYEESVTFNAPSKIGYTFNGWYSNDTFTSALVEGIALNSSGEITVYANFSINQYTISFDTNDGTEVEAITQNYATQVFAPANPSKVGYEFAGWYADSALKNAYTFTTIPAENITVYAKWNLVTYTITYQLDGGDNAANNPANYTIQSDTITLSAPTKRGYTFGGWYTDSDYNEEITQISTGSYGAKELFAKWDIITYTIDYVLADEANNENPTTYTVITDGFTLHDATLTGYTFSGWFEDETYTTTVTMLAGGEIGNVTLYGKFTANTYNVWLDGSEEATATVTFDLNGANGSISSQVITETNTLTYPTVPTRTGYLFGGWYANAACTGELYDFSAMLTNDITLYAKWVNLNGGNGIAINSTLSVSLNGTSEQVYKFIPITSGNVSITTSGSIDTLGSLYKNGTLIKQDDDSGSDGNFLIVYNVTAGEVYEIRVRGFSSNTNGTVTLSIMGTMTVPDGGSIRQGNKEQATYGESFMLSVPVGETLYKFLGWQTVDGVMYTDENGNGIRNWDIAEDTLLISKWERMEYTVTFFTNGGTAVDSITLEYGSRLDLNNYVTTFAGKTFGGWYLSASDAEAYNATTMPDHNIELYAKWITYGLGSIKYDTTKKAVSANAEITADIFNAICLDTNGVPAKFTVTVSGNQIAGETITVRLTATSEGKSKQVTISDVKVYGVPTLDFNDVEYFNIKDELSATWCNASGLDTFGENTIIRVFIEESFKAGDLVRVTIESIDIAGNKTVKYMENVKAYGLPEISYNQEKKEISVNDIVNAELFDATAKDSFGENLHVTVTSLNENYIAGEIITLRISACDSKGNINNIDIEVKVYDVPTIFEAENTDFKVEDIIDINTLGIFAEDTFGQSLQIDLVHVDGEQKAGNQMIYTATVVDVAGNIQTKNIIVKIYGTPSIHYDRDAIKIQEDATFIGESATVSFDSNGGDSILENQVVTGNTGLVYPDIPTRTGYVFRGWFLDKACTIIYDFSKKVEKDITLYAGWQEMVTSGYSQRVWIDVTSNYTSADNSYRVNMSGTSNSGSKCNYTYFTALHSGSYTIYYRTVASNNYMYIYNVTQNTVLKSNINVSSTSFASLTINAEAGDVIYIRNYRYSSYSWADFNFYVTGANIPLANGKYAQIDTTGAKTVLNAIAKDSFGEELLVSATLKSGELISGSYVVYTLTAVDKLGNRYEIDTAPIGVCDINDIEFTYMNMASDLIKLTSNGEEFYATAVDSLGKSCKISIVVAEGYELKGGETISLYIVAEDSAGNVVKSELISGIKVYDTPTAVLNNIDKGYLIVEGEDVSFAFTVMDSFGEELVFDISTTDTVIGGNYVVYTLIAEDVAGNIFNETYTFAVLQNSNSSFVELYIENENVDALFVDNNDIGNIIEFNDIFENRTYDWYDENGILYINKYGELVQKLPLRIELYAKEYSIISTAEDLISMESSGYYILNSDIDLNGAEWNPIAFSGIFDGCGHVIGNFTIKDIDNMGLFKSNSGIIKNLGVSNFTIDYTLTNTVYAGGLVGNNTGMITNCFVDGISVSCIIERSTSSNTVDSIFYCYVGGLAGYNSGTISNCYSIVPIVAGMIATTAAYGPDACAYAGGLVGYNSGTIKESYSTSNITAQASDSSIAYSMAGGLAGYSNGTIVRCFATGNVTSTVKNLSSSTSTSTRLYSYAGGLVGYSPSGVVQSYRSSSQSVTSLKYGFASSTTASSSTVTTLGTSTAASNFTSQEWIEGNVFFSTTGVWGFETNQYPDFKWNLGNGINNSSIIKIETKADLLKLKGQTLMGVYLLENDIDLGGASWEPMTLYGAFFGNNHTISNFSITSYSFVDLGFFAYNSGVIKGLGINNFSINTTRINANVYAGGLVAKNIGVISNCYAVGSINVSSKIESAKAYASPTRYSVSAYAGGLVCLNSGGVILQSYANVSVSASASDNNTATSQSYSCASSCYAEAGGLVAVGGNIINCYAMGTVNATCTKSVGHTYSFLKTFTAKAGGISANGSLIENCYALGNVTATVNNNDDAYSGGNVKTYAGGLIGYGGTIENSFATGNIVSSATSYTQYPDNVYIYGYVGYLSGSNATVTNSYRLDTQTRSAKGADGTSYNSSGISTPEEQLKTEEFIFESLHWDSDIWNFTENQYPALK